MTAIAWDEVGARRWQTGIDHGVLYLPDDSAVPWNGLTSLTEDLAREVKSYYLDGVKYLDHHVPGSFKATLSAFTYPDEFDELLGNREFAPGVFVHDQNTQLFNLSYRTMVGDDLSSDPSDYKIHVIYNVQASAAAAGFSTMGDNPVPGAFSWELTGTPAQMFGIRPTSHVSIDSRRIDPELLSTVEELLYGTDLVDPALPPLVELLELVS
jgi:hypothetical protein